MLHALLGMKDRIWSGKVNLVLALRRMEDGLAKEVLDEQIQFEWPGFAMRLEFQM